MIPPEKNSSCSFQELLITILWLVLFIETVIIHNNFLCFSNAVHNEWFSFFGSVGSWAKINFLREVVVSVSDDKTENWVWGCGGEINETHDYKIDVFFG